jgi:hypothetical protein
MATLSYVEQKLEEKQRLSIPSISQIRFYIDKMLSSSNILFERITDLSIQIRVSRIKRLFSFSEGALQLLTS